MNLMRFALLALILWMVPASAFAQAPPNVVVFVADDAGWRDFGAYGSDVVRTPNIDALAEEGLRVERAFLTIAQCSPSRISILTGKYPHATGAEDLHMPLPEGERLLPSYLAERGYFSGIMNKRHLGPNGDRQFDWISENLSADVPAFLDEADDRPFFLWVGFTDPHRPYDSAPAVHDPSEVNVPPYLIDEPETRADLARYYDEIHRMDGQIGRFVDVLEERGLREHTLVIFLSDNGMPFPGAKGTVYDEGIRTPLIFTWPGRIEAGTTYGGLVSVVDLAPTILEIAGMETPTEMQGSSIAPILEDRDVEGRTYVFSERNWHNCDEHIRGVRSERFKFVRNAYTELPHGTPADASTSPTWYALKDAQRAGTLTAEQARIFAAPRPAVELYDLENDPWEMANLAGRAEYEDVARELADVLDEWIRATDDFPPSERRRLDNTDRVTGVKFTMENPPFTDRH